MTMGSIISGALGFMGQRQTNEMQQEDFLSNQQFNAQQAAIQRDWETQMSDTAMQRRVQDLKAAGLNPLLAIGQGGASTPSGSAASAAGLPNLQNPVAAGINSAQAASAIALQQAQASAADAQATKTKSETPTSRPGGIDPDTGEITSVANRGHELGDATLANIRAQTGNTQADSVRIGAVTKQILSMVVNQDADTALKNIQALAASQNLTVLKGTTQALISIANADATFRGLELSAYKNMSVAQRNQYLGPVIGTLQSLLGPVAGALGVARGVGGLAVPGKTGSGSSGATFGNPDTVPGAPNMVR